MLPGLNAIGLPSNQKHFHNISYRTDEIVRVKMLLKQHHTTNIKTSSLVMVFQTWTGSESRTE